MKTLSSLSKGLNVLLAFTVENSEWGVRELSEQLGLPRSTVQTLLRTLTSAGLLMQLPNRRYRLGWRTFELAGTFLASLELRKIALPYMQELADTVGEVVHLGVLEGEDVIYVEKVEGRQSIPLITRLGLRYPAYCTGIGKVLLAFYHRNEELLTQLVPMTPNTITDRELLKKELDGIRSSGFSYDREESFVGLSCVATPVFDYTGSIIAGLSISAPTIRFSKNKDRFTKLIFETSNKISKEMGFNPKLGGSGR